MVPRLFFHLVYDLLKFALAEIALKEMDRVNVLFFEEHFIMQVRPSRQSCASYVADDLPALHALPFANVELREVRIAGLIAEAVIKEYHFTKAVGIVNHLDRSIACGVNGCAGISREIEAPVIPDKSEQGMHTRTISHV